MSLALAAAALPLQAQMPPPAPPPPPIVAPARPRAEPQSLIGAADYPQVAARYGEQGRVRFVLDVGVNGRVSACAVIRSSGSPALDSATCRLMRSRARFTPAMDATGQPASSRVEQEVAWTLPAGAAVSPAPAQSGLGMRSSSVSQPAVATTALPPPVHPPAVIIPQDGPGEADLSVWDAATNALTGLGRYESIPACREAKARLRLRSDQRAWCTLAGSLPR